MRTKKVKRTTQAAVAREGDAISFTLEHMTLDAGTMQGTGMISASIVYPDGTHRVLARVTLPPGGSIQCQL